MVTGNAYAQHASRLSSSSLISRARSAILFDGALPESKRAERLSRMEHNVKRIAQLRASYPTQACPIPTYLGAISYAFLAPALREALAASHFASRTHIVSGEADDWCAVQAQEIPKPIIFTSDTDLVLYQYHDETLVAFLQDADPTGSLSLYAPSQIRERLKVKTLVEFAFALRQSPSDSESVLLRSVQSLDLESRDYVAFSRRYIMDHNASTSSIPSWSQGLDVRISEFVHQVTRCLDMSLDVYLPLLLEDTSLASAWAMGQDIRTSAYSILAPPGTTVREYRRKAQGIFVQEISTSKEESVQPSLDQIYTQISTLVTWGSTKGLEPELLWALFAFSLVVSELNTQPSILLIVRVLNGDFDNTWDFVHLAARLQATLYSLRMLKQIAHTWLCINANEKSGLHTSLTSLSKQFESFPSIPNTFMIPGQRSNLLASSDDLRGLVEEVYASIGIEIPQEHVSNRKKKKQAREADRKKRAADQRHHQRKTELSNVYAALKQE